jgi:hypothetical protein
MQIKAIELMGGTWTISKGRKVTMAIPIRVRDYDTVMQHYFDNKQKESGSAQCPALLHFL